MRLHETLKRKICGKRSLRLVISLFLFTVSILTLGYVSFGFWTMLILSSGFFGGFTLWLLFPTTTPYSKIKGPYWVALALFLVHRVEEKIFGFFAFLAEITGNPTSQIISWNVLALVGVSVGAWLAIPWGVKRYAEIGHYLSWTFFTAMGVTELAHWLVFPFLVESPVTYIPGMGSVLLLAPAGWWGLYRLIEGRSL